MKGKMKSKMKSKIAALLLLGTIGISTAAFATSIVSESVNGSPLDISTQDFNLSDVTLNGDNQTVTGTSSTWTIKDPRGTGEVWSVSVSATNLTSAAGTVETTARTITLADAQMNISAGTITRATGSDDTAGITATANVALNPSGTLVSASASHKGKYTFTPSISLTIPANAYRSNYSGAVGSSSLNPYRTTLTVTIS